MDSYFIQKDKFIAILTYLMLQLPSILPAAAPSSWFLDPFRCVPLILWVLPFFFAEQDALVLLYLPQPWNRPFSQRSRVSF